MMHGDLIAAKMSTDDCQRSTAITNWMNEFNHLDICSLLIMPN